MIQWEQLDSSLALIGKDRTWLADQTPYTYDTIRNAMAPASTRRSDRMLMILSRAIEDEESEQATPLAREIRPGVFEIFQTDEQLGQVDRASRIVGAASISEFCRDVLLEESARIIGAEEPKARFPYPPGPDANLKVAAETDEESPPTKLQDTES